MLGAITKLPALATNHAILAWHAEIGIYTGSDTVGPGDSYQRSHILQERAPPSIRMRQMQLFKPRQVLFEGSPRRIGIDHCRVCLLYTSIPAPAGNTRHDHPYGIQFPVHPRACGEHA